MRLNSFRNSDRMRIAVAGVFASLFMQTVPAMGQGVTWSAPSSGFVFDNLAGTILPISGFLGSAVSAPPIMSGIQWAAVAPNQKSALVAENTSLLLVPDLNFPDQSQSLGSITGAKQALWSLDSSRAVILTEDEIVWLTVSNSSSSFSSLSRSSLSVGGGRQTATSLRAPLPRNVSSWFLLATDGPADRVLFGNRTLRGSQIWIGSIGNQPVAVPFSGQVLAGVFASTSSAVFIADTAGKRIVKIDDPGGAATATPVFASAEYFGDPAGIVLSADDTHVFIVDRVAPVIREFDTASGTLITALETEATAQYLTLFTPGRFVLDPARSGQPFLFLDTSEPVSVTFVPREVAPETQR